MSSATAMLRREHDEILRAVEVLQELARRLEQGRPLPPNSLATVQQFFVFVARGQHRDKKQELLFPLLRERGFSDNCAGVILDLSSEIAQPFQTMVSTCRACELGNASAIQQWIIAARRYAELIRQHVRRENDVLLMNAERLLTDADQQELAREFERLDTRARRAGLYEVVENFERVAHTVGM